MDWWWWLGAAASTSASLWSHGSALLSRSWGVSYAVASYLLWPVTSTISVLLVVFSPAIYMLQFAFAPVWWTLGLLPALEPLYIFFGCAAFAGVFAGCMLLLTSSSVVLALGLYDKPRSSIRERDRESISDSQSQTLSEDNNFHDIYDFEDDESMIKSGWNYRSSHGGGLGQGRAGGGHQSRVPWRGGGRSDGSSQELQDLLRTYVSVDTSKRRKGVPALLRTTIHEEDDDSE